MKALRLAKALDKGQQDEESADLLFRAYRARLDRLVQEGQEKEALDLAEVIRRRLPDRVGGEEFLLAISLRFDRLDPLLAEWNDRGTRPARRQELADLVRRHLVDPRAVGESPVLPESCPLRRGARLLWRAFKEAAAGGLSAPARLELRQIPRHSPLVDWRCFILALDAFHRREDEAVRRHLDRVSPSSPVAPGARILLSLREGDAAEVEGPGPLQRLAHRLQGSDPGVIQGARRLQESLEKQDEEGFLSASHDLMKDLARRDPFLAKRVARWCLEAEETRGFARDQRLARAIEPFLPPGEETPGTLSRLATLRRAD